MFIRIPDLNFSIPDPGSRVKKIPDPDTGFGIFLDSGKNYLGCSSWIRIRIHIFSPSRIQDPGAIKAPEHRFPPLEISTTFVVTIQNTTVLFCAKQINVMSGCRYNKFEKINFSTYTRRS
jgi:hypothetical protein